jgi:hypothetical protein
MHSTLSIGGQRVPEWARPLWDWLFPPPQPTRPSSQETGRETGPSDSRRPLSFPPSARPESDAYMRAQREHQGAQELLAWATRDGEPEPASIGAKFVADLRQKNQQC